MSGPVKADHRSGNAPVSDAGRRRWSDVAGVAWVVAASLAVLTPALGHGSYLGPFDILGHLGLSSIPGTVVHNPSLRDQISLFVPSTQQVWLQVHQGHLPLWNPDSGLGLPLAFNWESAPFGLPALVGYLVPLRLAYTAGVLVTLVVAGTGGYVFARLLRLGVIASAFVGTVFVLSGPMMALLGWSATSVGSWAGWLFAATLLVLRGRRRALDVGGLAVVIAFTVYAGHPETAFLLFGTLIIFAAVVLAARIPRFHGSGAIRRPVTDLILAGGSGAALAAPLLLPGFQLIAQSGRTSSGNYDNLTTPDHSVLQLVFQGFDGLPVSGSHFFGTLSYQWTAGYVGVIVLAMGALCLRFQWRRPEVLGLAVGSLLMAALVLVPGVPSLLSGRPVVGTIILTRALIPLAFGLAALSGLGLDTLARRHADPAVRRWALGSFAVLGLLLVVIWLVGRGHLPATDTRIRQESFVWPAVGVVAGMAVVGGLARAVRRSGGGTPVSAVRAALVTLLVVETAFLVAAGAPITSSNTRPLGPTPAVAALKHVVGDSLVGLGSEQCISSTYLGTDQLGVVPEANVAFGVHELALYDPLAPSSYYSAWKSLTGSEGGNPYFYQFCPAVSSLRDARRFGVAYILESHGMSGPPGTQHVGAIGDEELYRVPGASAAVLVPAAPDGSTPPDDAPGAPVAVQHPRPSTWRMVTHTTTPHVLRLHLTDVAGWHATIDGRTLDLERYSGVMLQARIPPGRHTVVVDYWPSTFTAGLILAGCSAVGLLLAIVVSEFRRRTRTPPDPSSPVATTP